MSLEALNHLIFYIKQKMPTVYILNNAGLDYSDAKRFGDLKYITEGQLPRHDIIFLTDKIFDALQDSSPEDMILIASLNSMCAIAGAIFSAKHGHLNFLLFRRNRYQKYTVITKKENVSAD